MPSVGSLIGTGIAFGCVHVLTGPDHLSALATLSANVGPCDAFSLGVRWGIGHSTGLVVVGTIFIAIGTDDTVQVPEGLTIAFESLVGIFMLFLGSIGMVRACRKRPVPETIQCDELPLTTTDVRVNRGRSDDCPESVPQDSGDTAPPPNRSEPAELDSPSAVLDDLPSSRRGNVIRTGCARCMQGLSSKMLACIIGIVHGVAGPGGVLGVLPAVQLKNWKYSTIYLGSFCISSTIIMGCYASLYGTCSRKLGKERGTRGEFYMEAFSASLSIVVGILWLVLLACGKLEDVFP